MTHPARNRVTDYASKPVLRRTVADARSVLEEHGLTIAAIELAPGGIVRILTPESAGDEFAQWDKSGKLG